MRLKSTIKMNIHHLVRQTISVKAYELILLNIYKVDVNTSADSVYHLVSII